MPTELGRYVAQATLGLFGRFLRLSFVPERVHLCKRRVLRCLSPRRQRLLDRRKTALEFPVRLPQQRFRIGVEMAREIDCGEQQITDLGASTWIVAIKRRFDLVGFFADLA